MKSYKIWQEGWFSKKEAEDKGSFKSLRPALGKSNNMVDKLSVHAGSDPLFQS